jgi:O-antigen ligase
MAASEATYLHVWHQRSLLAFIILPFNNNSRLSEEPHFKHPRGSSFPGTQPEGRGLSARIIAGLTLALLAPALGGGTSPIAAAVLLAGIGLAVLALPVREVRAGFLVLAGLVLAAALDWAWPARFAQSPWRDRLAEAGFPLAWSNSPQPWISLRAWLLLLGGISWAAWCAGQVWTPRGRRVICNGLALGIGTIALVALACRHGHLPGWPEGTGLGPFANRNQTATLFATGGFLTVVCAVERLRGPGLRRLALEGVAWLCLLGVYTAALAINRSRSGPLLFAGMTLGWAATVKPPWRRKPEALAIAAAIALLLGTVFLLTGRTVLARLAASRLMDFRLKIFSDTLGLIRDSPWTGAGLGCFNAIFPLYRNASILQQRVLHPESDWLWLTAEAGLPGLLAIASLLCWMCAMAWRRLGSRGEDRPLRLAACVACLGFLVHSFADVPGHRLGTVMPALLLLGLAAGPDDAIDGRARWVLQGTGLAVLAIGAASLAAVAFHVPSPLVDGAQLLVARAAEEEGAGHASEAEAIFDRALGWAPLDWWLYVERAQIEGGRAQLTAALRDFRRARFLEPDYAGLPYQEGVYWLQVAPAFAVEAWEEALRRVPPGQRPDYYQNMLAAAFTQHPETHSALWAMAATDSAMQLVYFGWAAPGEFRSQIEELLHEDPALGRFSTAQLRSLFTIWMEKGDARQLAGLLALHPEWLKAGYRVLAQYDAGNGDFPAAVDLMERYLPPPRIPQPPAISPAEAASRFAEDPGDIAAGMTVYAGAMAAGREAEALETLEAMAASYECPDYVHYLEARLLAKRQETKEAWAAFEACRDSATP